MLLGEGGSHRLMQVPEPFPAVMLITGCLCFTLLFVLKIQDLFV